MNVNLNTFPRGKFQDSKDMKNEEESTKQEREDGNKEAKKDVLKDEKYANKDVKQLTSKISNNLRLKVVYKLQNFHPAEFKQCLFSTGGFNITYVKR